MGGGYAQDQSALLSNVMVRKSAPGTDDERKAAEANDKLTKLQAANKKLAEEYGISLTDVFAGQGDGGNMSSVSASGSAGKSGERNKFQAEDDWLSIEKSKALAGYATGLMDYNEYIEKKAELDKQYLLKKLQNAEATEKEIADIVGELDKLTEKEVTQRNKEQFDAARGDRSRTPGTRCCRYRQLYAGPNFGKDLPANEIRVGDSISQPAQRVVCRG